MVRRLCERASLQTSVAAEITVVHRETTAERGHKPANPTYLSISLWMTSITSSGRRTIFLWPRSMVIPGCCCCNSGGVCSARRSMSSRESWIIWRATATTSSSEMGAAGASVLMASDTERESNCGFLSCRASQCRCQTVRYYGGKVLSQVWGQGLRAGWGCGWKSNPPRTSSDAVALHHMLTPLNTKTCHLRRLNPLGMAECGSAWERGKYVLCRTARLLRSSTPISKTLTTGDVIPFQRSSLISVRSTHLL